MLEKKPEPYQVVYLDHTFFKDYTKLGGYNSIRPGTRVGDPVVTDIRAFGIYQMRLYLLKPTFQAHG